MTVFFMVALARRSLIVHGTVAVEGAGKGVDAVGVAADAAVAEEAVYGDVFVMGTPVHELTPRLPISVESSGMPARAVVDVVEAGADDAAVRPEPHIPGDPVAAAIPELVDNPEVADAPDAPPVPSAAAANAGAVAGGAVPLSVTPPPS